MRHCRAAAQCRRVAMQQPVAQPLRRQIKPNLLAPTSQIEPNPLSQAASSAQADECGSPPKCRHPPRQLYGRRRPARSKSDCSDVWTTHIATLLNYNIDSSGNK